MELKNHKLTTARVVSKEANLSCTCSWGMCEIVHGQKLAEKFGIDADAKNERLRERPSDL